MSIHLLPPRRRLARSPLTQGFTLIEVMIVVGIVAILGAIALPSYNDYVRRGQLPEAFTLLSDYRIKMEQYYQDNRNYGVGADCGRAGGVGPSWSDFGSAGGQFFNMTCELTAGGQGYTITATGARGRATDHTYTINQANVHATTKFKGAVVNKTCWLVKGSEC